MPSQGSDIRRVIKGGLNQAKPPRLGADQRLFHIHRSASRGGASSHLFAGSKTILLNRVVIHLLCLQVLGFKLTNTCCFQENMESSFRISSHEIQTERNADLLTVATTFFGLVLSDVNYKFIRNIVFF